MDTMSSSLPSPLSLLLYYSSRPPSLSLLSRYPSPNNSQLDIQQLQYPRPEAYNATAAYGASKLCLLLLALVLHIQYSGRGVACNSVHPGNLLPTNLFRNAGCGYHVATMMARPFTNSVVCWILKFYLPLFSFSLSPSLFSLPPSLPLSL